MVRGNLPSEISTCHLPSSHHTQNAATGPHLQSFPQPSGTVLDITLITSMAGKRVNMRQAIRTITINPFSPHTALEAVSHFIGEEFGLKGTP